MTIKKYEGKTKDEAVNAAKRELGPEVVIMNIKEVKPNGVFGTFKKSSYEVTAAIEEEQVPRQGGFQADLLNNTENSIPSDSASFRLKKDDEKKSSFSVSADEEIPISSISGNGSTEGHLPELKMPVKKNDDSLSKINADDLKSAFKEVNDVIDKAEHVKKAEEPKKYESPVIKSNEYIHPENENAHTINRQADRLRESQESRGVSVPKENKISENAPTMKSIVLSYEKNHEFIKTLYNILISHDVDEIYINRILEEMGDIIKSENSLDFLIANVYQKIVLLLGNPEPIKLPENPMKRPLTVFFVGPTGVGKTTTIAKIASDFKVKKRNEVALITTDTYRIAATEQLSVYADILKVPMSVAYTPEDITEELANYKDKDLILVDTVGFSHKNDEQRENLRRLLEKAPTETESRVFLVLSTTTKYYDIKEIVDSYNEITDFDIIFTKLDETDKYGNILNTKLYSGKNLSYVTTGQNVPDDISELDVQVLTKTLLGGQKNGSGRTPEKRG